MSRYEGSRELVLAMVNDEGERRSVSLIEGESLALFEESSGPVTQVAYGADRFGHKVLCGRQALARALSVDECDVTDGIAGLFAGHDDVPLLSDVMDMLDRAGEGYTYMSWSDEGDVAYRPEACVAVG